VLVPSNGGRPEVVISDALPLDQEDCAPALKSLPPRSKARRFQLMSKATHGDALTSALEDASKRETRVRVNMVPKEQVENER